MIAFTQFADNLALLREKVCASCAECSRNEASVKILPVTKNHPIDAAQYALNAGLRAVGENRVQEAEQKIPLLNGELCWELIGHLQANKAAKAAHLFSRVQSVDSSRLAQKLDLASGLINKKLRVLLQINAGRDPAKFGADLESADALLEAVLNLKNLQIDGLMTIAPLYENLYSARRAFANLRNLRDRLERDFKVELKELSMGMTHDLREAILEGSTMIRVGTFLFGERVYE